MGVGRGRAVSFLVGVVDFEREDGEPVEDEAGSLGVEGREGVLLEAGTGEPVEEPEVHLLDEIVAALVEAVDGVLVGGNGGVGGGWVAGEVLFVPEVEVGAVVGHGELGEVGCVGKGIRMGRETLIVPLEGRLVVQSGYCAEVGHT